MTTHVGATAQTYSDTATDRAGWRSWLPVWTTDHDESGPSRAGIVLAVMSLGAMLVCVSYWAGRGGHPGAHAWFWLGQALLILPYATRVLGPTTPAGERLWLLTGLAALQSFLAWAYSPDQFRFPDELQHLRTVQDVLQTDHLFTENSYLPVSPGFPGMEVATSAVRDLTGMSVLHAGVLVVSLCHLVVPVLVFALVNELTGSSRTAAVAGLVYATAPHHAYYNTLFVYGAVALPFMIMSLWAALRARRAGVSVVVVLVPFLVATVSHHLTVAMTVLLLAVCVVVLSLARTPSSRVIRLLVVVAVAAVIATGWTLTTARSTFSYLAVPLATIVSSVRGGGGGGGSKVSAQFAPPTWESLASMAGAGVTLLLVVAGALALWRGRAPRVVQWFSLLGVAYPVILAIRLLAPGGAELASRGLTFAMLLVALPAAAALSWLWKAGVSRLRALAAVAMAAVMLLGSITAGLPPWWERVPHGFVLGGYESGVDRSVQDVGLWAESETTPGSRSACDVSVCSVVASYGRHTVTTSGSDVYYGSAQLLPKRLGELSLDYLFVDRRMTQQLPVTGAYFFRDVQEGTHTTAFDPRLLTKFDTTAGIDRVYDNGHIQAYATLRAWT